MKLFTRDAMSGRPGVFVEFSRGNDHYAGAHKH